MTADSASVPDIRPQTHWPLLDAVRFGAALLVLFGHVRGLLLVGITRVEEPTTFTRLLYLVSGLQHEGVILFFVVSGFLIGGGIMQAMQQRRFRTSDYLLNRFVRIYVVFVPALILVGVLNGIGVTFLNATRFYGERPLFPSGVFGGWTWDQIPCHLFAVQGVLCLPWGADPPLWTLGYEWVFYLVAPALFALMILPASLLFRAAGLAAIGCAVAFLSYQTGFFHIGFAIWLLGAVAHRLLAHAIIPGWVGAAGGFLCVAGLVLSRTALMPQIATDAMVAAGLAAVLTCPRLMALRIGSSVIRRGADFSYSLYLIHLPLCIFIGALMERYAGWPHALVQPDARGIAGFLGLVALAIATAWAFARVTEDHTAGARRWLRRKWRGVPLNPLVKL